MAKRKMDELGKSVYEFNKKFKNFFYVRMQKVVTMCKNFIVCLWLF